MCVHADTYSQCQIPFCYTCGSINAGSGITVPLKLFARYTVRHLRFRRSVQFIFAGAVRNNVLTNRATLLCRTCVDPPTCVAGNFLALRRGWDMGAHCALLRQKKSSAVPLFEAVAGLWSAPDHETKGNGSPKRVETAGVYPFGFRGETAAVPLAAGAANTPASDWLPHSGPRGRLYQPSHI